MKSETWTWPYSALLLLFALVAALIPRASAQLAPTGAHYAGRPTDTGYSGTAVDATGNFPAVVPLQIPPARAGVPIPLQIVYGAHAFGAVGLGWEIPLSYLRQSSTFAHSRPASPADAAPVPRVRTTLSLLGQTVDLIQQGDKWVAQVGTLEMMVRQSGGSWFAYDGQGRTYTFDRPTGLPTGLWLLKSIAGTGGSNVLLDYDVSTVPINGGVGTTINLVGIGYNTHSSQTTYSGSCAKNEIALSYSKPSAPIVYAPNNNSLPAPLSMSILDNAILVRNDTVSQIDIESRNSCGTGFQSLRRYVFSYFPDADTGQPQLQNVKMFGRQGTPEETIALPVSAYGYGSATTNGVLRYARTPNMQMPAGIAGDQVSGTAIDSVNAPESGQGYSMWQSLIDFDGDGRPDLVFKKNNKLWIAKSRPASDDLTTLGVGPQALVELSDSTLTSGPLSTQTMSTRRFDYSSLSRNTTDTWRQAIDVNGDGRIDIVDAAEEAGHWVVYLNTPGGPSGIKWVRRSFSILNLIKALSAGGHPIKGDYLPLSRQSTGTSLQEDECLKWDGTKWQWLSPDILNPRGCPTNDQPYAVGPEVTYLEWEFTDLNGDGYPDFVFDTTPADFQVVSPRTPTNPKKGEVTRVQRVWVQFKVGTTNHIEAAFNVLGVLFDVDRDAFAKPVLLTPIASDAIGAWTCENAGGQSPCAGNYQFQTAGLADVNGDGLLDRVTGGQAFLGMYSGVGSVFSAVYINLPGSALATQSSTHDQECNHNFGKSRPAPTAREAQGLRDLTGDGIPDYVEVDSPYNFSPPGGFQKFPRIWVGTGTGFRLPIQIQSLNAPFQLSHETETCDGKFSETDAGLYDIDGDGKPEVVGLDGNNFVISHLVGGRVFGTPESGRLTSISNSSGAKTTIDYVSAKQFEDNSLPFPELVVNSISTAGTHNLGGTLDGSSYAYGGGVTFFNSALDRFVFSGYERQVAVQLLDTPKYTPPPVQNKISGGPVVGSQVSGAATITDTWPLAPFSIGMTKQQRWLREHVVGQIRDNFTLRFIDNPDPWSLLGVQPNDSRVTGETQYTWDAKYYETPVIAELNPTNCFDIVAPLDYEQTITSLTSNSVDVCRSHGFAFPTITTAWLGDAAPPSDRNIQTRTDALAVDDFGRAVTTEYENDLFRTDDDYCVENTFAVPSKEYPRVLTAVSTHRVSLCGKAYNSIIAGESWTYDNLSPGAVSDGHITSHDVDRRASDTGALLKTVHGYDATYDGDGNISSVRTQRDSATRNITFRYDGFGIVPVQVSMDGTGVPSTTVSISYDPLNLLPLTATDSNNTKRGTDYDGFGRPIRSTVTLPGGTPAVLATSSYLGFDGIDPQGQRIQVTRFQDPVDPAKVSTSAGRSATRYYDELGRERRTEVLLGSDYSNRALILGYKLYDGAGRLTFLADPFSGSSLSASEYGTSFYYKTNGDIDCAVRGHGYASSAKAVTDTSTEYFPTCFQRSFTGHVDTLNVLDASSLQANSPQAGVVKRVIKTAIGLPIERSTLKVGVLLEDEKFAYDRLGQWTSMTRFLDPANGNSTVTWSRQLDSLGQILQLSEPATATHTYNYSDWGEPVETGWTDGPISHALYSAYDSLGRLIKKEERNNGVMDIDTVDSYSYDTAVSPSPLVNPTFVLGELASATSPKGSIAFSYDPFGRINARTFTDNQGGVYVNRSEQHADGSLSSVTFNLPDDSYASEMVKYGYDSAGRLRTIQFSDATGKQDIYSAQSIDDYARPTAATYGGTTSYQATYENGGRRLIQQLAVKSPKGSRQILFGQFDPLNRELSRQELTSDAANGRTTSLSYDALGRLATSSQTNGTSPLYNWKFEYDALGNIRMLSNTTRNISATLIYDTTDKDRLCHVGYADTVFGGWLDGLVTGSLSPYVPCNVKYDETGNIVTEATRTGSRQLSYFLSGNVRTITQKDKKASFAYGPFDQLQTLDVQTSANTNRHEEHYGALIERHDVASAGGTASFITRNIPGPSGVLASRRGFTKDWIYGFGELRGNRFSTNKDGSFVQNIDYQPFGESKSTGAAPDTADYTSYQWNGGEELAAFGVSHLGARVYDPVIGRFLSRDPLLISRTASSSNPYAFAANDPWNAADPSGLDPNLLGCDEECENSNIGFQPFPLGDSTGSGSGTISADWVELHHPQVTPPTAFPLGPHTQEGIALRNQVLDARGYAPSNFNFDRLASYGFTVAETLERIDNSPSVERNASIDAHNAWLDTIGNTGRVVGLGMFALGTGGIALAEAGAVVLASQGMTATAELLVGDAGASAALGTGGLGGAAASTNELETDLDELGAASGAAAGPSNVDLFRAVSPAEFNDINATGSFRTAPGAFEAKQFGLNLNETLNFAETAPDLAAVVRVTVPQTTFNMFEFSTRIDPSIFPSGVVTVQPELLDLLNSSFISIKHVF